MKSKKVKYLLIVFVVMIWSTIIYKIYTNMYGSSDTVYYSKKAIKENLNINKLDSFNISFNYPDPFLKRNNTESLKREPGLKPSRQNSSSVKIISKWPEIRYNGLVSGKAGVKLSFLVSINGKSYIMQKGELQDGVEILSTYKDSIKMKYENMVKYYKRYEGR